jgi:hypothetical protein
VSKTHEYLLLHLHRALKVGNRPFSRGSEHINEVPRTPPRLQPVKAILMLMLQAISLLLCRMRPQTGKSMLRLSMTSASPLFFRMMPRLWKATKMYRAFCQRHCFGLHLVST